MRTSRERFQMLAQALNLRTEWYAFGLIALEGSEPWAVGMRDTMWSVKLPLFSQTLLHATMHNPSGRRTGALGAEPTFSLRQLPWSSICSATIFSSCGDHGGRGHQSPNQARRPPPST